MNLTYSKDALNALHLFLSYRNEIVIFTEDDYSEKEFYKILFNKVLPERIITQISN